MTGSAAILDTVIDALGSRLGLMLDGRPADLRLAVVAANEVRRRQGLPEIVYPCVAVAPERERGAA